jgi:hypothetical protein
MINGHHVGEAPTEAPLDRDDNELEQLLADVHRLAYGLDNITRLVIEGRARVQTPTPISPVFLERVVLDSLRRAYHRGIEDGDLNPRVPAIVIADAIRVLEASVRVK